VLVAAAALAAPGEHDPGVGAREVGDQVALGAERLRPDGHGQLDRGAVGAVLAGAAARLAAAGLELRLGAERGEVAQARIGDEHDVAAAAAVAAVGTALRHVLLAPEAQPSVAPSARQHLDAGAIVEQGRLALAGLGGRLGDRDEALLARRAELDDAFADGEDRVVAAEVGARAGAEAGAALADDDHAGLDLLAREDLDAEALRVRVAAVAGGAEAFLVSH
jgi:hypothetical protein